MSDMIPLEHAVPLPVERPPGPEVGHEDRNGTPLLSVLAFLFLTFNSGMAVYSSRGDYMAIAFVSFSYLDLLLLFYYLRWYERAPPQSCSRRVQMKMAIWGLSTLLTVMFSYKVAAVMPLPAAVLVWAMTGAAALGFYGFFVHQEEVGILGRSRAPRPGIWISLSFSVQVLVWAMAGATVIGGFYAFFFLHREETKA